MSNFAYLTSSGKNFMVGPWLFSDYQWSNDNKYSRFVGLIVNYDGIFTRDLNVLNLTNRFVVPIQTTSQMPIFKTSLLPANETNQLNQLVNNLLQSNIIRRSYSEWSSPVRSKEINGKLEIIVDYSYLNSITVEHIYNVPSIQSVMSSIEYSNLFSKIVIIDAFHQIGLTEDSKHKTAFALGELRLEFQTLHSGMKYAQQYLQQLMELVLANIDQSSIKIYLGHILINTTNFDHHFEMLRMVFEALNQANLKVDIAESSFLMTELVYLGHHLSPNGISISAENLDKIRNFETPRNQKSLKQFIGLVGQFKLFVPDYDRLASPLNRSTSANYPFNWSSNEQNSFERIKRTLICSAHIPFKTRYYVSYYPMPVMPQYSVMYG